MRNLWKLSILVMGSMTILATNGGPPEKPKPPIRGNLEYRIGRTLEEQPVTHVRVTSIAGERCYNNTNGTRTDHAFIFDDPRDRVTVDITDINGVPPGQSYVHRLYFKEADGSIKREGIFEFRLSNPFTATEPAFVFTRELAVGGPTGLAIAEGMELGGIYEFSETDRNLTVDLEFVLQTDIPYTSVCGEYD